ncbi:MAG: phage tail protein [Cyanobacteria bacterium J06634_6]
MARSTSSPQVELAVTPSETFGSKFSADTGSPFPGHSATVSDVAGTELLLHPGRRGELTVQIKNVSTETLRLRFMLEGRFPRDWFITDDHSALSMANWSPSAVDPLKFTSAVFELAPEQKIHRVLPFMPSEAFFEAAQALENRSILDLRYGSKLFLFQLEFPLEQTTVESTEPSELPKQLVGYHAFDLYVRPSQVYLNFLPEIYQQSDFLSRFLGLCEQSLEPSFDMADMFWAYLDPLTAPKLMMPFLSHWVGWPMNPFWTLQQQRKLVRHAVSIYQWRGTPKGLRFCLHLFTELPLNEKLPWDEGPIQIRDSAEAAFVLGDGTPLQNEPCLGGGIPHHFSVTLCPQTSAQAERLRAIGEERLRGIIEQEKPAFCTYELAIDYSGI